MTIKAGNPDNWYLSSHRAIAVSKIMLAEHVNPQRMGVVGYADQHPVASNGTEAGRAANRRVEVLILPTQVSTTQPTEMPPAAETPAASAKPAKATPHKKATMGESKDGGPMTPVPNESK